MGMCCGWAFQHIAAVPQCHAACLGGLTVSGDVCPELAPRMGVRSEINGVYASDRPPTWRNGGNRSCYTPVATYNS